MAEIDTGPGLEAQFSWDYSHANSTAGPFSSPESKLLKRKMHCAGNSEAASAGGESQHDTIITILL